jgi:hypothetical protein
MKNGRKEVSTVMIHPTPRDLMTAHEDHVTRLRREIHRSRAHRTQERRMRRWVGRQLVRVGTRIAADPTLRPVRPL